MSYFKSGETGTRKFSNLRSQLVRGGARIQPMQAVCLHPQCVLPLGLLMIRVSKQEAHGHALIRLPVASFSGARRPGLLGSTCPSGQDWVELKNIWTAVVLLGVVH